MAPTMDAGPLRVPPEQPPTSIKTSFWSWLFLLYALPTIVFLAMAMPPFQVADEHAHAMRADQISRGVLISPRLGGMIDGTLKAYADLYADFRFRYEVKVTAELARAAATLRWGLPDHDENFQNTAQYGPAFYMPPAAGLWIGKLAGLNPAWSMLVARLVNGCAAVLIGFLAIRLCRRGQAMLFTTLLLPMTLSQFASVSQDASIISLSILAIAIASRILAEARPARTWEFALFALIVVATTMARPSHVAQAVLGLAFVRRDDALWGSKVVIGALALVCIAAWISILPLLMPAPPPGASVSGQLSEIVSKPLLLPTVLVRTLWEGGWWLFETLVGRLGWLDTPLPRWYDKVAVAALICAWLAPGNRPPFTGPAAIALATVTAVLLAASVALYASWTPVGKAIIDGAQGRYMLPVLPLLGWLGPIYGPRHAQLPAFAWVGVALFPLVSLAVLPGAIMARYYGSWPEMATAIKLLFFS